jgi:hypothetical protein
MRKDMRDIGERAVQWKLRFFFKQIDGRPLGYITSLKYPRA